MTERVAVDEKTYGELHDELARRGADLMGCAFVALEKGNFAEQRRIRKASPTPGRSRRLKHGSTGPEARASLIG